MSLGCTFKMSFQHSTCHQAFLPVASALRFEGGNARQTKFSLLSGLLALFAVQFFGYDRGIDLTRSAFSKLDESDFPVFHKL